MTCFCDSLITLCCVPPDGKSRERRSNNI